MRPVSERPGSRGEREERGPGAVVAAKIHLGGRAEEQRSVVVAAMGMKLEGQLAMVGPVPAGSTKSGKG